MGGFINDGTYKFFDEWYAQNLKPIEPCPIVHSPYNQSLAEHSYIVTTPGSKWPEDWSKKVTEWLVMDEETTPEEFMKKLLEEDAKHPNKPAHHKELMSSFKEQVAGSHYKELPIQPIEFITKNDLSFIVGNIIKYACRADKKGGADDIKKCIHYARMLLEQKYNVKSEINYAD